MQFKINKQTKDFLDSFIGKNVTYKNLCYTIKDWQPDEEHKIIFLASTQYIYDRFSFTPIHKTDTRFFPLENAIKGELK